MNQLSLKISNDILSIYGEVSKINKPSYLNWFRREFAKVDLNEDSINIQLDKSINSEDQIKRVIDYLKYWFKDFSIVLDESAKAVIDSKLKEEEDFNYFIENAREIRNDNYKSHELDGFCNSLIETLPNRRLFKLQALSAYHLAFSQNACNFSVPGAGKTSIVYGAYSYLKSLSNNNDKYVNKIVVIGPLSSFTPWEEEYIECFGSKPNSFKFSSVNTYNEKIDVLRGITSISYDLLLFSYQSLPALKEYLIEFMTNENNSVMLVCDEAHKFKNVKGIWADSILNISKYAKSRVVLTGTPAPNGYEDMYNLFKFIYPNKNVVGYTYEYLKQMSKNPVYTQIDDIINNITPFFLRIKKSDLNLPESYDYKIENNLNSIEYKIYDKLSDCLKKESFEGNKTSIFFRMIQASSNLHLLNKTFDVVFDYDKIFTEETITIPDILGSNLYDELLNNLNSYTPSKHINVLNLVKKLKSENKKVVIWGYFTDSIKRLHSLLQNHNLNGNYVIGETIKKSENSPKDELNRENIIKEFKDGDFDYLISNPVVLGESISLHKVCHDAIYFERSYSAAPYIQSRDRIHRVWLDENYNQIEYETNYHHIISSETVDSNIVDRVNVKFKKMLDVIEDEIPLYSEDLDNDRKILIEEIISNYRRK